jgi:hypothetical protein
MIDRVAVRILNVDLLGLLRRLPMALSDEQIDWVDYDANWAAGIVYEQEGRFIARFPDTEFVPISSPLGALPPHAVAVSGMVGHLLKGDGPRWNALDLGDLRVFGGAGAPSRG